MHDRNGTPLKAGDRVMLPATVIEIQAHADYCNATVKLLPMRGSGGRDEKMVVNTAQLVLIQSVGIDS